jgi:hypothetical protein
MSADVFSQGERELASGLGITQKQLQAAIGDLTRAQVAPGGVSASIPVRHLGYNGIPECGH